MNNIEAYQPIIEDGRGIFPEDMRFKAPRGMRKAIAKAAESPKAASAGDEHLMDLWSRFIAAEVQFLLCQFVMASGLCGR